MLATVVPIGMIAVTACSDSTSPHHGPAALAQFIMGDDKTDSVGGTFVDTMVVQVTDSSGNHVPNVTVNWAASTGTLSSDSSVTDGNGHAQVIWTFTFASTAPVGTTVATVAARVGTASIPPFTATQSVVAGPGNPIPVITGGNNQSGVVGTALLNPLTVHVVDQHGNPLTFGQVTWTVANGSLSTTATPATTPTTTLNTFIVSDGTTQAYLTLGSTPGANPVTVHVVGLENESSTSHLPFNLTFTETAIAAP
jgi:hypothetical protein